MPLWAWLLVGAAILGIAFLALVIWAYPRDNSF